MTICKPGVFQYHDCGLPECCTPPPPRMRTQIKNHRHASLSAELEVGMAASLTICGIAS